MYSIIIIIIIKKLLVVLLVIIVCEKAHQGDGWRIGGIPILRSTKHLERRNITDVTRHGKSFE